MAEVASYTRGKWYDVYTSQLLVVTLATLLIGVPLVTFPPIAKNLNVTNNGKACRHA